MLRSNLLVSLPALVMAALACALFCPSAVPPEPPPVEGPTPGAGPEDDGTQAILGDLGAYPCPDSEFTCVSLGLPLDHFDSQNPESLEVVFAVLPARGVRKGMFVTVVGGPGGSGLAVADSYTGTFDDSVTEHFDIVFFDQRGIAASGGLQCTVAAAKFYQVEADPTTPEGEALLAQAAETFAGECASELGRREFLPYLGTEQAIEDLEAFRQAMGDESFWLYGESYGTQFVQTYAAMYPQHLSGLILDGPVDLTLTGIEYYLEQTQAFSDVLEMTLSACAADEACAADMEGDPWQAYDQLASQLEQGPIAFDFPLPGGGVEPRAFTLGALETGAASYLYSETPRMILLRALAASVRGDLVPLARVFYDSLVLDPETLAPTEDPSWSDAIYYAVECNDYDFGAAEELLRAGDPVEASIPRLASIFYGDLPCSYWPEDGFDPGRPEPLVAEGIPTLVMVGTADPATPVGNARRIIRYLADGYLVIEDGGPHVIFGWGNACVDDLVTAFLVDDGLPDRETSCDGVVTDPYIPLAPIEAAAFADPLEALASVDTEIFYLPEYYYWDLETPTRVGCPFGGVLAFEASDVGESLSLADCAFSQGFVMTGTGEYDYGEDVFQLDVSVTGLTDGQLVYVRQGDGSISVSGEYGGETVELSE